MNSNSGLTVLLNHRLAGQIHMAKSGAITFQYDQSWLDWEHAISSMVKRVFGAVRIAR